MRREKKKKLISSFLGSVDESCLGTVGGMWGAMTEVEVEVEVVGIHA